MQANAPIVSGACRDRMNRLGAGASSAADTGHATVNSRPVQQGSSGTVEALQQRMLQHLNHVS